MSIISIAGVLSLGVPGGGGGGCGSAFPGGNPIAAKLAGWWDADHVTVAGGSTTVLCDGSGNANNLAAIVAAPAPTTVSGKLVVQANVAEHYEIDPLVGMPAEDDISLIAVARSNATGNDDGIAVQVGSGGGAKGFGLAPAHGNSPHKPAAYIASSFWDTFEQTEDHVDRHLYLANKNGNVTRAYKNGAPLMPIFGHTLNTPFTKASILGADHFFGGDWRAGMVASSLTRAEIADLTAWVASNEGTADDSPAASYLADDDFSAGSSIDIAGTRFAGATPWTAFNLGSLTNAIASGKLSLTLPQESVGVDFRGYTQPVITTGGQLVQVYRAKIIPANIGAADKHRAMLFTYDTVSNRALTIEVGYDSGNGSRQARVGAYHSMSPGSFVLGGEVHIGGFSSGDWNDEWTLWFGWNDYAYSAWFQVGTGKLQYLYADNWGWFAGGGGTRPQKIGLGVSSQNASGGNTVADFTDFAREY